MRLAFRTLGFLIAATLEAPGSQAAPAANNRDSLLTIAVRIENAVGGAEWRNGANVNIGSNVELRQDRKLWFGTIFCKNVKTRGDVAGCKIGEVLALRGVPRFSIDLGKVDPASYAIKEGDATKNEEGFVVTFACQADAVCLGEQKGGKVGHDLLICRNRESCEEVQRDFAALVKRAPVEPIPLPPQSNDPSRSRVTPGPQASADPKVVPRPTIPSGPRSAESVIQHLNGEIDRAFYYSGRNFIVTRGFRQAADGQLELQGHTCAGLTPQSPSGAIQQCRGSSPANADNSVLFKAGDLDSTTVRVEDAADTYRVVFLCRNKAPCVMRPNRSAYFPGAFIACADRSRCNAVMVDLFALINAAVAARRPG